VLQHTERGLHHKPSEKNGVAKQKSSTKYRTRRELLDEIADLKWRLYALTRPALGGNNTADDNDEETISAVERLAAVIKLVKFNRSTGYKSAELSYLVLREDLGRWLKNPRGAGRKRKPPLGADDHYPLLIKISQLDPEHWHNKSAITKALLPIEYKNLSNAKGDGFKSLYKKVDKALKFFKDNPNFCPDLIDILSKLPRKTPL